MSTKSNASTPRINNSKALYDEMKIWNNNSALRKFLPIKKLRKKNLPVKTLRKSFDRGNI